MIIVKESLRRERFDQAVAKKKLFVHDECGTAFTLEPDDFRNVSLDGKRIGGTCPVCTKSVYWAHKDKAEYIFGLPMTRKEIENVLITLTVIVTAFIFLIMVTMRLW